MSNRKWILPTIIGLCLGLLLAQVVPQLFSRSAGVKPFFKDSPRPEQPLPSELAKLLETDTLTQREAEAEREDHYQNFSTISNILSLPTDFAQTEALYVMAGKANVTQLQTYIRQAQAIENSMERRAALNVLFLRYTALDPIEALNYLNENQFRDSRQILDSIFSSWSKIDLAGAIAAANQVNNPAEQKIAREAILQTYAYRDDQAVDLIAKELNITTSTERFQVGPLVSLAQSDPNAAFERALAITDQNAQRQSLYRIVHYLANKDPRAALGFITRVSGKNRQRELRNLIENQWARSQPEAAINHMLTLPPDQQTPHIISTALATLAESDTAGAMEIAANLNTRSRNNAYQAIFSAWGNSDIRAAVDAVGSIPDPLAQRSVLSTLGGLYAMSFPDEALGWANQLDASQRDIVRRQVLTTIARNNPEKALNIALEDAAQNVTPNLLSAVMHSVTEANPLLAANYLSELSPGEARNNLALNITRRLARQDPQQAFEWINQLEGNAYTQSARVVAEQLVATDLGLAAQLTDELRTEAKTQWVSIVAAAKAAVDYQGTLSWLARYEGEPFYANALNQVIEAAARTDPSAATQIYASIPPGSDKSVAAQTLLYQWSLSDPKAATEWANSLENPESRSRGVSIGVKRWARNDLEGARNWILSHTSGEEQDNALLAIVQQAQSSGVDPTAIIESISSERQYERAVAIHFMHLASYNLAKATAYLDDTKVRDAFREQLKNRSTRGRHSTQAGVRGGVIE